MDAAGLGVSREAALSGLWIISVLFGVVTRSAGGPNL